MRLSKFLCCAATGFFLAALGTAEVCPPAQAAAKKTAAKRPAAKKATTKPAPAEAEPIPDFQSDSAAWISSGGDFKPVPGTPGPVGSVVSGSLRLADTGSPILKPWVAEVLKRANAQVVKAGLAKPALAPCRPPGVPLILTLPEPMYVLQQPKDVTLIYQKDGFVRHVALNAPHAKDIAPSWFGDSVGHYDGDTLVIDTLGLTDQSWIDAYRTPHSLKLHVTESYQLRDGGNTLHAGLTIEDPDTFTTPWAAFMDYSRTTATLAEPVCTGDPNTIPTADEPDF